MSITDFSALNYISNHQPYSIMIRWIGVELILLGFYNSLVGINRFLWNHSFQGVLINITGIQKISMIVYLLGMGIIYFLGFYLTIFGSKIKRDSIQVKKITQVGVICFVLLILLNTLFYTFQILDFSSNYSLYLQNPVPSRFFLWHYFKLAFCLFVFDLFGVALMFPLWKYKICESESIDQFNFWQKWLSRGILPVIYFVLFSSYSSSTGSFPCWRV